MLQLVVVAELDVVRVTVFETEAKTPLIVHRDGVLPRAIASQRVQAIAGWHLEIGDSVRDMHGLELPQGAASDIRRHLPCFAGAEELFGLPVGEGLDHVGL